MSTNDHQLKRLYLCYWLCFSFVKQSKPQISESCFSYLGSSELFASTFQRGTCFHFFISSVRGCFIFLSGHWLFSCQWFQFPLHWTASEVTLLSLALVLLSMSRTELTYSRLDFDLGMLTQNEQAWTHFQSIDSSSLNSFFYLFISYVQDIQL